MDELGADQDRHRFAGEVFAELADVMGADGGVEGNWIAELAVQMAPKPRGRENTYKVQSTGRQQPARTKFDLEQVWPLQVVFVGLLQVVLELPADEEEDHEGQHQFDAAQQPTLPRGFHSGIVRW